jgi:hypothetical protein
MCPLDRGRIRAGVFPDHRWRKVRAQLSSLWASPVTPAGGLLGILRSVKRGEDLRLPWCSDRPREVERHRSVVRQIVTDAASPGDDSRFDYTAYGLNDTEKDYSGMNFYAKCPYKFAGTWGYYDGAGRGSDQTADAMALCGHPSTPTSRQEPPQSPEDTNRAVHVLPGGRRRFLRSVLRRSRGFSAEGIDMGTQR